MRHPTASKKSTPVAGQRINFRRHLFSQLDQRRPAAFETFAGDFPRRVNLQFFTIKIKIEMRFSPNVSEINVVCPSVNRRIIS
jgi:hypothetical protein